MKIDLIGSPRLVASCSNMLALFNPDLEFQVLYKSPVVRRVLTQGFSRLFVVSAEKKDRFHTGARALFLQIMTLH